MSIVTMLYLVADIPECERGLDDCDQNATCINTIGSYDCLCNTGFTGDGFTCIGNFVLITAFENYAICMLTWFVLCLATCVHAYIYVDFDECIHEMDNCHENATCNNTYGSFECTCNAGFEGNGINCTSKCEVNGGGHRLNL